MRNQNTEDMTPEEIVYKWFDGRLPDDWSEFDDIEEMVNWQLELALKKKIVLDSDAVRSFFKNRISSFQGMIEDEIERQEEDASEEEIHQLQFEADGLSVMLGGGDRSGGGLIGSDAELERADKAWRKARGD